MRIFSSKDINSYFDTRTEFEKEKSNAVICTESLSLVTMPDAVVADIIGRFNDPNWELPPYLKQRKQVFEENL